MTLSADERAALVGLAKAAVAAAVKGQPPPAVADASGVLGEMRGCFVTLTTAGRLRGCIGTFTPQIPLGEQVVEMAAAAATEDPRFWSERITPEELSRLDVEVSVLSPLTPTDEPEKLEVGRHGIYVVRGGRSGCFLPEVATDQGWGAEEFLSFCCAHKAGLPADAWKQPGTKVYLFTSEKFDR